MSQQSPIKKTVTFYYRKKLSITVLMVLPLLLYLGGWQLQRAEETRNILAIVAERSQLPVVELALAAPFSPQLYHRRIQLSGEYLTDHTVLVDNQIVDAQFGYEVVSPFRLADDGRVVLVSRGWTQGDLDRTRLPAIPAVGGQVTLQAKVHLPAEAVFSLGEVSVPETWPKRVPHLSIEKLQPHFAESLLPFIARLEPDQPGVLRRHWLTVNIMPEKHTGYAVQWFAMAAVLIILWISSSVRFSPR